MDKIKAWLGDSKNLPILIVSVLIIVGIIVFILKASTGGQTASKSAAAPSTGAYNAASAPATTPPPSTAPGGMGTGAAANPAPAAPASPAAKPSTVQPMLPYRKDPFLPLNGAPTKDTILASLLPQVVHYQAPAPLKPLPLPGVPHTANTAPVVLPPQPFRRMAGVLTGDRVSAIMETNGQAEIVYPGMELTSGNSRVRVESITSDEIILKTLDTKKPATIRVNLSGAVVVPSANTNTGGNNLRGGVNPISPVY